MGEGQHRGVESAEGGVARRAHNLPTESVGINSGCRFKSSEPSGFARPRPDVRDGSYSRYNKNGSGRNHFLLWFSVSAPPFSILNSLNPSRVNSPYALVLYGTMRPMSQLERTCENLYGGPAWRILPRPDKKARRISLFDRLRHLSAFVVWPR